MLLLWFLAQLRDWYQVFDCYVIDVVINYKMSIYGTHLIEYILIK